MGSSSIPNPPATPPEKRRDRIDTHPTRKRREIQGTRNERSASEAQEKVHPFLRPSQCPRLKFIRLPRDVPKTIQETSKTTDQSLREGVQKHSNIDSLGLLKRIASAWARTATKMLFHLCIVRCRNVDIARRNGRGVIWDTTMREPWAGSHVRRYCVFSWSAK